MICRAAQKSVNLRYSLVIMGMFTATEFLKRYHSVLISALNMEDLISKSFLNAATNEEISNVIQFTI